MTRRSIAAAHTRVCFLASAVVRISPPRRALITAFRAPLHRRLRERLYVWRAAGHEVRPRQVIHDDIRTHANIVDIRRRGMSEVDMTVPLFIKDTVTVHALSVIAVQLNPTTLPPAPIVRIPSSGPRWLSCRIAASMSAEEIENSSTRTNSGFAYAAGPWRQFEAADRIQRHGCASSSSL